MEKRAFICIGCPLGCELLVSLENSQVLEVSGNSCKNGEKYAKVEAIAPKRIVTTTVAVAAGTRPVVSVKTANPIPKEQIFSCMETLQALTVTAPVTIGQVLLKDVAGSPIVATASVEACL